ncbi:MAG: choice-of-anchor R domain-containing protein [Candidatus Neomarinimicrobiota bacterium]|jgi:hypothetical protein
MALFDHYNTGDTDSFAFFMDAWEAQNFTATDSYSATSVRLKLAKVDSPGTITVSIRESSAGIPTGSDLSSGTTNGNTLTEDPAGEWREITFSSPIAITESSNYAIIARCEGIFAGWRGDFSASPVYSGYESISEDAGETWTAHDDLVFMFEVYGTSEGGSTVEVEGSLALTMTLTEFPIVELEGTMQIQSSLSGRIYKKFKADRTVSQRRIVVAGNNQIYYEVI